MELVSDLPDDIIRACLIRVSYEDIPSIASVCKDWMAEVQLPEFHRVRKNAGHAQKLIVVAQARVQSNHSFGLREYCSAYGLTIYEQDTDNWRDLPLAAGMHSSGLPVFYSLAGLGSDLVVMGGWVPATPKICNLVLVYDFISARWRRGVDMPGGWSACFGYASDPDRRMIYVAGGHDKEKMALKSAMAYDVAKDEWVTLPDMARERDECKAMFHAGKFHVIGGYSTQGRFESSAEAFDVAAQRWEHVEEEFLDVGTSMRTCVGGDDGAVYMCRGGDVVALKGAIGRVIAKLPTELCHIAHTAKWQGKLLVIGCASFVKPHVCYLLDLKSYAWTKLEAPKKHAGYVHSVCYLEI